MRPTRIADLVLLVVGAGACVYLVARNAYDALPTMRWFMPTSLVVLGGVEFVMAGQLRARIQRRRGAALLDPLVAARAVALAKASALVGAVFLGAWAGLLGYTVPRRDTLSAANSDTNVAAFGVVAAAFLIATALWLEHCCKTPPRDDDDEPEPLQPHEYDALQPPRD